MEDLISDAGWGNEITGKHSEGTVQLHPENHKTLEKIVSPHLTNIKTSIG